MILLANSNALALKINIVDCGEGELEVAEFNRKANLLLPSLFQSISDVINRCNTRDTVPAVLWKEKGTNYHVSVQTAFSHNGAYNIDSSQERCNECKKTRGDSLVLGYITQNASISCHITQNASISCHLCSYMVLTIFEPRFYSDFLSSTKWYPKEFLITFGAFLCHDNHDAPGHNIEFVFQPYTKATNKRLISSSDSFRPKSNISLMSQ